MAKTFDIRIRADKSGPEPEAGQPWPCAGVEITSDLHTEVNLPTSFIARHLNAPWLEVVGVGWVSRPSRPEPLEVDGVLTVAPSNHHLDGGPLPHSFMHAEAFVFDTLNHGKVTYRVVHQPDKYVDSDDPTERVTREHYDAGNTRVDHFYTCVLED